MMWVRASSTGSHLEGVVLREVVNDFQRLVVQLQVWETHTHATISPVSTNQCHNQKNKTTTKNPPKGIPLSSRRMLYVYAMTTPLFETMPMISTTPLSSSSSWKKKHHIHFFFFLFFFYYLGWIRLCMLKKTKKRVNVKMWILVKGLIKFSLIWSKSYNAIILWTDYWKQVTF